MSGENKLVVGTFLERLSAGEVDRAFELIAPGATWFSLSTRTHADALETKAQIEWAFGTALTSPIRQQVLVMTAEENRVAVLSEGHATTVEGVAYDNLYHFLFELDGGLIERIWEFNDTQHVRDVLRRGEGGALGT